MRGKGFSLVEVLLTLSIILSLSLISVPVFSKRNMLSIEKQTQIITGYINQARSNSLNNHEKTELNFNYNSLEIIGNSLNKKINLDPKFKFSNANEIYYNEQGNINMANHVDIISASSKLTIIFNLGSGSFYVK